MARPDLAGERLAAAPMGWPCPVATRLCAPSRPALPLRPLLYLSLQRGRGHRGGVSSGRARRARRASPRRGLYSVQKLDEKAAGFRSRPCEPTFYLTPKNPHHTSTLEAALSHEIGDGFDVKVGLDLVLLRPTP